MSLPKKSSHALKVDGKDFRYAVSQKSEELRVTVQEAQDKPGRQLHFKWPGGHELTPDDVRNAVRDGMKAGWNPSEKGGPFQLP